MGPRGHFYSFELSMDPGCHVIGTGCILGRAPRKNETLPDFRE